ncbi:sensor histidine kinase [Hominifimenecus sp. rT4P-3]|uniref:sensor histidine kinase n=1 Tax=Hominifimenecus sp. rT4P-3 TaxID=3242979 RepID=UPI003DA31EFD
MLLPKAKTEKGDLFRNLTITVGLLGIASLLSFLYHSLANNTVNIAILYMLVIVIIARNTTGYLWGIAASVVGIIAINFFFTAPFFELNFSLEGYPITFAGMLAITLITSTTTTHLSEQTQLNLEREKMLMEAEKEKMRANLLRAISHDLRTPLTSIIGASATYLESEHSLSEEEKRQLICNVHEDGEWLLNMVENLLSVTRISDKNTTKVNKSLEAVEEVIAEAITRLKKRIPTAAVSVSMPDDLILAPMDPTLIEQVLINLMENAIRHSHSEQPIECLVSTEESLVRFSVYDYGIGIDPNRLSTIFDGYSSDENNSGDSSRGMGIGLSICKTIVAAHDGTIEARNHERGAVFSFTLPLEETS